MAQQQTPQQSMRGGNWGVLQADDATGTLRLNDPTAPGTHIVKLGRSHVTQVLATRADLVVTMAANPDGLTEIKFAVPKDSTGFEQLADAPRQMRQNATRALGLEADASSRSAVSGDYVGKFERVQVTQPNGQFDVVVHTGALLFKDLKGGQTLSVPAENVARLFLLPMPQAKSTYLVIAFKAPVSYGAGLAPGVVFVVPEDAAIDAAAPWRPEGIKSDDQLTQHFGETGLIKREMSGPTCEVLASVFKTVLRAPLNAANSDVAGTTTGTCAVRTHFRGSEGWLFILKNQLLFLHRPVTLIPYAGLVITEATAFGATATLGCTLKREGSAKEEKLLFGGLEAKRDFPQLMAYLQSKGVKSLASVDEDDEGDDEGDEESDESYSGGSDDDDDADSDFDSDDGKKKKKHRDEKSDKKSKKEKKEKKSKKEKKEKRDKKDKKDKKHH